MDRIRRWYNGLPYFTRKWLGSTLIMSLCVPLLIDGPKLLILDKKMVTFKQLQVWRFLTSVLYHPFDVRLFFNCFHLVAFSERLETGPEYHGLRADYCFLLILIWLGCTILSLYGKVQLLMEPMLMSIIHIWTSLNPDVIFIFWIGLRVRAEYLTLVQVAWTWFIFDEELLGQQCIGILVGQVYFYLRFDFHRKYGGNPLIQTPQFLINWFDNHH